jgi:hypothetical protein
MLVATAIAYLCRWVQIGALCHLDWVDPAFFLIETIFFLTSRDTLGKYYRRTEALLSGGREPATTSPSVRLRWWPQRPPPACRTFR